MVVVLSNNKYNMKEYIPYTYYICWSKLDLHYYGSRTAKVSQCLYETGCHPNEFWKTYFTSSEEVKKVLEEHGNPDIIEIRKTFPDDPESCWSWEGRVLRKLKPTKKKHWLNASNLSGVPNSWSSVSEEERLEHCKNISRAKSGKPLPAYQVEAMTIAQRKRVEEGRGFSGHTDESKDQIRSSTNSFYSTLSEDEKKEKARVKVMTQEEKNKKVSDGVKRQWENKNKDVCQYCGFETFFLSRHLRSCK